MAEAGLTVHNSATDSVHSNRELKATFQKLLEISRNFSSIELDLKIFEIQFD